MDITEDREGGERKENLIYLKKWPRPNWAKFPVKHFILKTLKIRHRNTLDLGLNKTF